jgi:Skp family chaperone for outer membrane proteins
MEKRRTMMKMTCAMLVLMLATTATMAAAAIGVVDMEKLVKLHPRTAADRTVLETYVEDFEVEREGRVKALKVLSEEFEALRKGADDLSLSEKAAQEKRRLAQVKFDEMRQAERELREIAAQRQKELTNQEVRLRTRVIADIKLVVEKVAAGKSLDLVLDAGSVGGAGYSAVVYADKAMDITDAVTGELLKKTENQ